MLTPELLEKILQRNLTQDDVPVKFNFFHEYIQSNILSPDDLNSCVVTAIFWHALESKDFDAAEIARQNGANLEELSPYDSHPLVYASKTGNIDAMAYLINTAGIDKDTVLNNGMSGGNDSPLLGAINCEQTDAVKFLVETIGVSLQVSVPRLGKPWYFANLQAELDPTNLTKSAIARYIAEKSLERGILATPPALQDLASESAYSSCDTEIASAAAADVELSAAPTSEVEVVAQSSTFDVSELEG